MNAELSWFFPANAAAAILLATVALYCMIVSRNMIRVVIGLELLNKAVTLMLAVGGYLTGRMALAQALIITLIVVEVVVIAVAAGLVIAAYQHTHSLDVRLWRQLKG